jgi:hypothetical protein
MLVRHDARGDFWMADDGGVRLFMASYALNWKIMLQQNGLVKNIKKVYSQKFSKLTI